MNRFQVKLGHLSNYIRNFSPIKSIAIMERIVNHPILTIPQEGEHTFLFNGKPVTGMKGFTIAAALHQAGYPVHSHSVNGRNRSLNCGIGKCGACVMLEPIQGEGGVHVPSDEYLQGARALCDKYDALLIFDEIQSGVGRTGQWFAYMHTGIKPDVLTFAKGIGGGFPTGGFCVDEKLAHVFKPGDHGGTFGGNALACAAIEAALTTIKEEGLVEAAAEKGKYFMGKLQELKAKYPEKVTEVRGRGLILGMELCKPGGAVVEHCLKDHVIVNCTAGNVIRLVPPLIVTEKEIDTVVTALDAALAEF